MRNSVTQMFDAVSCYTVEQRVVAGETVWVAIRARGAEWSWLTPEEAAQIGEQWVERYGKRQGGQAAPRATRKLDAAE
jgi:hypothetical protein